MNVLERAEIWLRGSSSSTHPKKAYRIEFQDENGNDLKRGFAGMPAESDWILYPSYIDKSLVRDVLVHDLWREMGWYAPRYRFVELFMVTNRTSLESNVLSPKLAAKIPNDRNTETPKEIETAESPKSDPQPKPWNPRYGAPLKIARNARTHPDAQFNLQALVPQIASAETEQRPKVPWYEGMPEIESVWPGISKQGLGM